MRKIILALMIVMVAASFAVADTIYLRDGRTIQGTLLGFINGRFVVRVDSRQSNFPRATTDPNARDRGYEGQIQYFRPDEVSALRSKAARWTIRGLKRCKCRLNRTGSTTASI